MIHGRPQREQRRAPACPVKRPNFFIIGAPKCGTTSLAAWLSAHPQVYMSPAKEPHFFSTDLDPPRRRGVPSLEAYEALFRGAGEQHLAVGEASTGYLYSAVAVGNILRYVDAPRFVVMLRNPVEMAPALHEEQVYQGNEHVQDFRDAWDLQAERAQGRAVTRWCRNPALLLYGEWCRLGTQLERLYRQVPRERVLVLLLDDVRQDPRREYLRVLRFLGVPDDGREAFPVLNRAKRLRSVPVKRAVLAAGALKRALGIPGGLGLLTAVDRLNRAERPRPPLDRAMRAKLVEYFAGEVRKLEQLLGRDLAGWLEG